LASSLVASRSSNNPLEGNLARGPAKPAKPIDFAPRAASLPIAYQLYLAEE
jgi:hypothetical protein